MLVGLWIVLGIAAAVAIVLDFGWPRRRSQGLTTGEALLWTLGWLAAALVFDVLVYTAYAPGLLDVGPRLGLALSGAQAATEFLTAFLVTKTLALANVFVIALVLLAFAIPLERQHRVLFWGLVGALALRALFLLPGLALAELFAPAVLVFGALLLLTAAFLLRDHLGRRPPQRRRLVSWLVRRMPVTEVPDGRSFLVRSANGWSVTPLGLALVVILSSDLLFAADALPAAFAVTRDPFLVLTSNVLAVLGLRALYFLIAPLIGRFRPLEISLVLVLAYVGVKALVGMIQPIPTLVSLTIVSGLLAGGVAASLIGARRQPITPASPVDAGLEDLVRFSLRHARRIVVTLVGSTVLLVGVALLVLPGPGLVVIAAGLAMLSTEFVWARRWMQRIRSEVDRHNPLRRRPMPEDTTDVREAPPESAPRA